MYISRAMKLCKKGKNKLNDENNEQRAQLNNSDSKNSKRLTC